MNGKRHYRYLLIATFIVLGIVSFCYPFTKEYEEGKFAEVVHKLFRKHLGFGEALVWQLGYNGIAVKLPGNLLVFDYLDDKPVVYKKKKLERSLLTGVIEPKEIKDERVILFFSHEHSAENFLKALEWRKEIPHIYYVVTEEIFEKYKSDIEDLRKQDQEEADSVFNQKDILDLIKIAKLNRVFILDNMNIKAVKSEYLLDTSSNKEYPGVEFIVEAQNGVTIYHSGAFTCHRCYTDTSDDSIWSRGPKAISAKTKSMVFKDGKLVSIDGAKISDGRELKGNRIAIALYAGRVDSDYDSALLIGRGIYRERRNKEQLYPFGGVDYSFVEKPSPPYLLKKRMEEGLSRFESLVGNSEVIFQIKELAARIIKAGLLNKLDAPAMPLKSFFVYGSPYGVRGGCYVMGTSLPIYSYTLGYWQYSRDDAISLYSPDPRELLNSKWLK